MSSDFKSQKLREVIELVIDNRGKNPKEYSSIGIPVIDNYLITSDGQVNLDEVNRFIDENTYNSFLRKYIRHGDVLMTLVGNGYGKVAITPKEKCAIIQNTVGFRCNNDNSNKFLYYLLRNNREIFMNLNRGAAQPSIKVSDILELEFQFPSKTNQEDISSILGALDDRITLLRETNQTLEAIAQALFKSWFVDFDPVRAKAEGKLPEGIDAATAALFPDAFEESELGLVPKGWVIGRLIDFAKLKGGKMLSKEHFSVDGEFPVYGGAGEMGRSNMSNAEGFVITVGRVGAYCGQYFWHSGKAWVNNNASHVVPNNVNYSVWLYQWLRSVDMDLIKKGAAQPFVSNGDIENLQIILPTASVIEEFVNVCEPLFKRMSSVLASILTLTNLRDSLLPRLISGQLRIADAETELEKAMA